MTGKLTNQQQYYSLIALWVLCEAMLGGIIHGMNIPLSGLLVGGCAAACICLIAWYAPSIGAILKATVIVAVFKMMLSPQAPLPAYIAVFFQGLLGELLFWNRRYYKLSCLLMAVLSLIESGLQGILLLTIIYGNDFWTAINDFINGLTGQSNTINYSIWLGLVFMAVHLVAGLLIGWWVALLPLRISKWATEKKYTLTATLQSSIQIAAVAKKRKRIKAIVFIIWILFIALYVQSYYKVGPPLLPSHVSLKIFLRSFIIILGWVFLIGPLMTRLLHQWLSKKQTRLQLEVQSILVLLPATRQLVAQCWKQSSGTSGLKRLIRFGSSVISNVLTETSAPERQKPPIYFLTGAFQTGKTTTLTQWATNRKNVYGILSPVVNSKRIFADAHTGEQFPMETTADEKEVFHFDRFVFSKASFARAIAIIKAAAQQEGWLVIDEVGPIEIQGNGFHDVLKELLAQRRENLLLVVREGMADEIKKHFGIDAAVIITLKDLPYID